MSAIAGRTLTTSGRGEGSLRRPFPGIPGAVGLGLVVLGSIASTSASAQRAVPRPGPAATIAWQVAGEGFGRPVVDKTMVYFLSVHHEVEALEAATGRRLWKQSTSEPGDATAGFRLSLNDSVVVASDDNLVAFDKRTGSLRWRFVPTVGHSPGVYLGPIARGIVVTGSPAGRLFGIDAETGLSRWTTLISGDGHTTIFTPSVDGDLVVAGYTTFTAPNTGGVVAVDLVTGNERWRTTFPRSSNPSIGTGSTGGPIIVADLVIASAGDGTIFGLHRDSGAILWSLSGTGVIPDVVQGPIPLKPTPVAADYRGLAAIGRTLIAGSLTGTAIGYDLDTRRERWRYFGEAHGSIVYELGIGQRVTYVPFAGGRIVALDASGVERWRTREGLHTWAAVEDGDRAFASSRKEGFIAYAR